MVSFCYGSHKLFSQSFLVLDMFSKIFFWWDWDLNTGLPTSKAAAVRFQPHIQSCCSLWLELPHIHTPLI
jgi:hypothetical protein